MFAEFFGEFFGVDLVVFYVVVGDAFAGGVEGAKWLALEPLELVLVLIHRTSLLTIIVSYRPMSRNSSSASSLGALAFRAFTISSDLARYS